LPARVERLIWHQLFSRAGQDAAVIVAMRVSRDDVGWREDSSLRGSNECSSRKAIWVHAELASVHSQLTGRADDSLSRRNQAELMHMRGRSPGRTLGRYLRPDGYGTLLLLIVASILLVAVASDVNDLTRVLWLALTGGSLLVALRASGARPRILAAGALLVGAVLLISPVMHVFGGKAPAAVFDNAAAALLLVGAAVAIGRRLARHPVIAISTVLGAVCLYLLVGMFFGALFALLGDLEGGHFFAATGTTTIDYLYFSFSTMTTVGDGTLTPQGNLERMLAVSEAVAGQLYLVTVIAFLAANFGHTARRRPESDRARSGGYAGRASRSSRGRPRRRVGRHGAVPTR